jgi:hypothetical protein
MIPKIAVYCVNYGNYRNELKYGIDNIYVDKNIDYYFFTDNKTLKSKKWNIIYTDLKKKTKNMDSYRHTVKFIKFNNQSVLKKYDILIYVASKRIDNIKFSYKKILNLIKSNRKEFYFIKHPNRKTSQEELLLTTSNTRNGDFFTIENKLNGLIFYNKIKNIKYNTNLVDLCCVIRINNKKNNYVWNSIYNLLMFNGLKRDQNVIQHGLFINRYESNISYFNFWDINI